MKPVPISDVLEALRDCRTEIERLQALVVKEKE